MAGASAAHADRRRAEVGIGVIHFTSDGKRSALAPAFDAFQPAEDSDQGCPPPFVTGTKELDTSESAGVATGRCMVDLFLATDVAPPVPTTLTLDPSTALNVVEEPHAVTATLVDQYGEPVRDYSIRFSVVGATSGSGACVTDVLGQCTFTFAGAIFPGTATITACTDAHGDGSCEPAPTAVATKEYVLPQPSTGSTVGGGRIGTSTVTVFARSTATGIAGDCLIITGEATIDCLDATAYVQAGSTSTIYGHATINGVETLYRIRVVDTSTADFFLVSTASGYELTGTLTSGNIRVR
jgi:Bacterial Ig-like domain (group 1)